MRLGISKRKRYLVGVSGGRDSIALLHWLKFHIGCEDLIVCHLNHSLRGRESGLDARFVRSVAKSYGFKFEYEKKDVLSLSKRRKIAPSTGGFMDNYHKARHFERLSAQRDGSGTRGRAHVCSANTRNDS